jgi:hypothetical protein
MTICARHFGHRGMHVFFSRFTHFFKFGTDLTSQISRSTRDLHGTFQRDCKQFNSIFIPRPKRVYHLHNRPGTRTHHWLAGTQRNRRRTIPNSKGWYLFMGICFSIPIFTSQLMDSSIKRTRVIAFAVAVSCGCAGYFVYKLVKLVPIFKHSSW